MVTLKHISKQLYDQFYTDYKYNHFMQTSDLALRRSEDGWVTDFIGFYKDDVLIGIMALANYSVFLSRKKYEVTMGPLLNYDDLEESLSALLALKNYMDSLKAISCEISPNIIAKIHYPNVESKLDIENIKNEFERIGFNYQSDSDEGASKIKWFFKKYIKQYNSYEDLADSFDSETKRLIKNAKSFPLEVVKLAKDDLKRAVDILDVTAKNRNFNSRSLNYHNSLYDYMNKNNEAKYLVVQLNVKKYLEMLKTEANDLTVAIAKDQGNTSKRAINRLNQNKDQLVARENRIDQLKTISEKTVDICSGVFIGANKTMTYLFGGSKPDYMRYYGTYLLQDYTIKMAYDNDYEVYDFFGTLSTLSGYPENEGVFMFKRGFGGQLEENIGFFEYKPKTLINTLFESLREIKHRIKKWVFTLSLQLL